MTTRVFCPQCQHVFERPGDSGCIECPKCQMNFVPSMSEQDQDDALELQSSEADTWQADSSIDDELRLGPVDDPEDDDGSLRVAPDKPADDSSRKRESAELLLQAAREAEASRERSQGQDTLLDQVRGQSSTSSRHFQTVIAGVGVMFGGLLGLARVAGHYTKGRTGGMLPALFIAVAGAGICIIIYGICRGVIEMVSGSRRRTPRS